MPGVVRFPGFLANRSPTGRSPAGQSGRRPARGRDLPPARPSGAWRGPVGRAPPRRGRLGPRGVVPVVGPRQVVGPGPLLPVLLERDPDLLLLAHTRPLANPRCTAIPAFHPNTTPGQS